MAVAYQQSLAGTNSASSSTAAVNLSTRWVGELVFALISRASGAAPTAAPSGWTLLQSHLSIYGHWLYGKVLTADDLTTVTWTWSAASKTYLSAHIYSGHNPTSPVELSAKSSSFVPDEGVAVMSGTLTTPSATMLVIFGACYSTASRTYTPVNGYVERYDAGHTNPDFWHTCLDTNSAWPGGSSTQSVSISSTATYRGGFHVAIAPAESQTPLPATLLTCNGIESSPEVVTTDAPRFDMRDNAYQYGYRVTNCTREWEYYSGGDWVAAGDLVAQVMTGYLAEISLAQLVGKSPDDTPFADGSQWRWRGKFGDYEWSDWGYFTFDLEDTALHVTSPLGTLDAPYVTTETKPTITWLYTKTLGSYCVTVIDDSGARHQSTGWVSGDDTEYVLAEDLDPGGTYAVRVEVRDTTQTYSYAADLTYIHVNDAALAAPVQVPEPDCDSVTPVVLEWADPETTDGDTMAHFNITLSGVTSGGAPVSTIYRSNPVGDDGGRNDLELGIGVLTPGVYEWQVQAVDEHGMEGTWSDPDEFTVTRAPGGGVTPDPGAHPLYEPTRPLLLEDHVQFVDPYENNMGLVPAAVQLTQRLDGSNTLDRVTVPKTFLLKTGYREDRPDLMSGWEIRYAGQYHTIEDIDSDHETETTFRCRSREAWELSRIFSSTSIQPFLRIARIPNEIMYDLLKGEGDLVITNGGGFESAYVFDATEQLQRIGGKLVPVVNEVWRVDDWKYHRYKPSESIRGPQNPVWKQFPNLETPHGFRIFSDSIGERQHVARLWGVVPPFVFQLEPVWDWTSNTYETVYLYHPMQMFGGPPGSQFQVAMDARFYDADLMAELTSQGTRFGVGFLWFAPDRQTVIGYDFVDWTSELVDNAYTTMDSGLVERKSEFFYPCFIVEHDAWENMVLSETPTPWQASQVRAYAMFIDSMTIYGKNLSQPSKWTYSGNMYQRETEILHTADGWIEFGTWTVGESDISTAVANNRLVRVVTGQQVVIHFNAGDPGATVSISYDEIVIDPSFDVSGAVTYTIDNMDPRREHIVAIKTLSGARVRVAKFVQDTWNRLTVSWSDMNVTQCLDDILKKTGGELAFDTVNRRIYHQETIGENLETEEVMRLQRGVNIVSLRVGEARAKVYNRLTLLGYGEGENRLRVTVDANGVVGGKTSQEVYGIQHGVYSDTDISDWYAGYLDCQAKVEQQAWPAVSYDVQVLDEAAAWLHPGDYVRVIYDGLDETVRVLEIKRQNDGSPASLVVGDRVGTLADTIADIADQVDKLSRK